MIEAIEEAVIEFLGAKEPKVLVIKGAWGIGKTYAWSRWLEKAAQENEGNFIPHKQYSYVSLFGCNSLDELKALIFEQSVPISHTYQEINLETLSSNLNQIVEGHGLNYLKASFGKLNKFIKSFGDIPFVGSGLDLWRVGWFSVRDQLICIDDLERAGRELDIKDIYGLVSLLKEQKKCKVVIIVNDENIAGERKPEYEKHREKVVDIELHYKPECRDLVRLVFPEDTAHYEYIEKCIISMDVENVRTIQKIKNYLDKLSELLGGSGDDDYYKNAINSISLFTVLYFSRPEGWPSLEEALETDTRQFSMIDYLASERNSDEKIDKNWVESFSRLKAQYDWNGADDLDQIFGEYVKKGFLNKDNLSTLLKRTKEDAEKIKLKNEASHLHSKVGDVLWDGFENNTDELIAVMKESIEKSTNLFPSIGHLNQYVSILRKLNENEAATDLVSIYVELARTKNSAFLRLRDVDIYFSGVLDAELSASINEAHNELYNKEIAEILSTVDRIDRIKEAAERCPEYRLTEGDYEILSRFEEGDFEAFLRTSEESRQLRGFMEIFLSERPSISGCVTQHRHVQEKLIPVVKKLSQESELNNFRLMAYLEKIERLTNQEESE
ncbi:hypothetical protein [Micavibrio aeruginosavorus]|uniref:KAP NTPase domain-containing protein n=1 Tax=Micavibrio aeruginosavorus EPB TaxID=349215 RepID=M4VHK8_9BACT|nr:hypothetical protein [Micavibrio aeruginosavorus]AGH98887.1 hypothetical protein A11S_2088 [Micavibrio aeruginosavorus EPB]